MRGYGQFEINWLETGSAMPYLEVKSQQGNKRLKLDGSTITVGRVPGNVVRLKD